MGNAEHLAHPYYYHLLKIPSLYLYYPLYYPPAILSILSPILPFILSPCYSLYYTPYYPLYYPPATLYIIPHTTLYIIPLLPSVLSLY